MLKNNKQLAIKLRQAGLSYNEIIKKIPVTKSTLSYWFGHDDKLANVKKINIQNAKKKWAANITAYNKKRSLLARSRWKKIQKNNSKKIGRLNKRELMLVGTALYWAEGYKKGNWNVIFCNADPATNRLMLRYFLNICKVPLAKIKAQIQIHHNIKYSQALSFWSKTLGLSKQKFLKPIQQTSKASKFKRHNNLPYGTLRIKINDVELVNQIKGWITGISEHF